MIVYNRSGKALHIPGYGRRESGDFWELPDWLADRYAHHPNFEVTATSSTPTPARSTTPPVTVKPFTEIDEENDDA